MICPRHKTEYAELCAGCFNEERDNLIGRLQAAQAPYTAAELRRLDTPMLRTMTPYWEHRKRHE
jgi:hypothetical protein